MSPERATAARVELDAMDVEDLGGGALYFATVQVAFAQKGNAVPMSLAAVLVPDGKTFKWVSLNFTTELATN